MCSVSQMKSGKLRAFLVASGRSLEAFDAAELLLKDVPTFVPTCVVSLLGLACRIGMDARSRH